MNEQNQGNKRGNSTGQPTIQSEKKTSEHIVRNGFEIFSFDSKAIVSWGLLSGLVGLVLASVTVYRSFGSQVDERISNNLQLNRTLIDYDNRIKKTEENQSEIKNDLKDIVCYLAKGKDPRCK